MFLSIYTTIYISLTFIQTLQHIYIFFFFWEYFYFIKIFLLFFLRVITSIKLLEGNLMVLVYAKMVKRFWIDVESCDIL